ncbi:DUF4251 domain-containing protein [Flavobacterium adhaerens]|uniref:DUF4251 domain-containing protein n=1 Tax=Flavobacterium adhaerens TaxID=3149043 RepID=UPI0032B4357B
MKTVLTTFCVAFFVMIGFSQEKSKKELKQERELAKQAEIEALVNAKEYEFVGDRAIPQGVRSIDLTTNPNFFRFEKDTIHSAMPFFGRGFAGVGYGNGDGGMDFKGFVNDYSLKKGKKSWIVKANVKDNTDTYTVFLEIYFDGNAYLSINSNKRSPISYNGAIHKLPVKTN